MKAIIGLGNLGKKYEKSRHNAGFIFLNYFLDQVNKKMNIPHLFREDKYLFSEIVIIKVKNDKIILAKPQTFMNLSGQTAKKIINRWKIKINNLIIVHDDLDIPLGKFKIQIGIGPLLHNGIKSIEKELRSKYFLRVRIGIDNRKDKRIDGEKYVLDNFSEEEINILHSIFPQMIKEIMAKLLV